MSDFHMVTDHLNDEDVPEFGYMGPEEIKAWETFQPPKPGVDKKQNMSQRCKDAGVWEPHNVAGMRWAIGCVALEITQRCNLDCTLCYLSERSEEVKDIPLEEIYRRIDLIHQHYGANTDVQVTGGDPTLRKREELLLIIKRIADLGMRPTLFTNGIKCTRDLIIDMINVGLVDIAFHVDTTQERKGYTDEKSLHKVRLEYINRARGLPVSIYFNTTVHASNFLEIPEIVKFFRENSDVVRLCSFQLQADTGRGVLRERAFLINPETVAEQIQKGAGVKLDFDTNLVGHKKCNRYAMALAVNGRLVDLLDDQNFIRQFLIESSGLVFDRNEKMKTVRRVLGWMAKRPKLLAHGIRYVAKKAWTVKSDLIAARGDMHKLTFFIHNFMDAQKLERDRCHACVFMTMTADGPISMCVHNAKRDDFILRPLKVKTTEGEKVWHPLTGSMAATAEEAAAAKVRAAPLKGRAKSGEADATVKAAVEVNTEKQSTEPVIA